jgi:hypothetical protein
MEIFFISNKVAATLTISFPIELIACRMEIELPPGADFGVEASGQSILVLFILFSCNSFVSQIVSAQGNRHQSKGPH